MQLPTLVSLYLNPSYFRPSSSPPPLPFKGWNIITSSSWLMLLKPRKSTFCSLSCEYRRKHSGGTWVLEMCCIFRSSSIPPSKKRNKNGALSAALWPSCCHQQVPCVFHPPSATGREVFDWILDQGYYSERDTSNVMRQVLEAVAYLHSLKIVHRNLKVSGCTDT